MVVEAPIDPSHFNIAPNMLMIVDTQPFRAGRGEGRRGEGEKGEVVLCDATHLLAPTMLRLNLFFIDHWKFRRLLFEESLTETELILELARQMNIPTADIVQINVVGHSRFSAGAQPEHPWHRYLLVS